MNIVTYRKAPTIYLAGQINGLAWEETTAWRDQVAEELGRFGIDCYSPLRAKSYLRREKTLDGTYDNHVLSTQRGIFGRDYFDCVSRDLLFVNYLGATRASLGTAMEVAWAYHARKPIVICIEDEGNPNDHPMLIEAARFRVNDLETGMDVAKAILLPISNHSTLLEERAR